MKMVHSVSCGLRVLSVAVAFAGLSASAKTVTWIGGDTEKGVWKTPGNWDTGTVPTTGDTVVFTNTVKLTDEVQTGTGLTISNTKTVTIAATLKGSDNGLVKKGTGKLVFAADTYTGYKAGLRVEEGTFSFKLSGSTAWGVALSNKKSSDLFGKDNKVVVTKTGVLEVNTWCSTFDNPVEITAHAADVALVATGTQTTWTGKITSDSDFTLQFTQWNDANGKPSNFTLGEISAPGKTVTLLSRDGMWGYSFLKGEIDANLVLDTQNHCAQLTAKSLNPANTLTLKSKYRMEMTGSATWGGRLVLANGGALVDLLGEHNLCATSFVSIDDSETVGKTRLRIDNYGYTVRGFAYNGVPQGSGTVSASTVGEAVIGSKELTIDDSIKMWKGGASGQWSDAANWETAAAPMSGDTAIIPNDVAFAAETVDVGADGLTVVCYGNVGNPKVLDATGKEIDGRGLLLSGSGTFVKKGPKKWTTGGKYTLTGGVRIEEGQLVELMNGPGYVYMTDALGTGTIEITGSGSWYLSAYCSTNTQPVVIHDHDASTPIYTSGSFVNLGTVTADADFTICSQWEWPAFLGEIVAPGKTVTYLSYVWNDPSWTPFTAEFADVDANFVINSPNMKMVVLSGTRSRPGNGLTLKPKGRIKCPQSQGWGAVSVSNGSSVEIPQGSVLRGESVTLGGTSLARGKYTARKLQRQQLDGYLVSAGKIQVGDPLGAAVYVR